MRHGDRFTHATDRQCAQPYVPGSPQRNAPTTRQSGKPKNRCIHGSPAVPWILPVIITQFLKKKKTQPDHKRKSTVLELTPRFILWWREEGPWHHLVSSRITLSIAFLFLFSSFSSSPLLGSFSYCPSFPSFYFTSLIILLPGPWLVSLELWLFLNLLAGCPLLFTSITTSPPTALVCAAVESYTNVTARTVQIKIE